MRYLLDTNIIAEPTKLQPNINLINALTHYAEDIAISAISWHELWYGTDRLPASRKRTTLEIYLTNLASTGMPILPYTQESGGGTRDGRGDEGGVQSVEVREFRIVNGELKPLNKTISRISPHIFWL